MLGCDYLYCSTVSRLLGSVVAYTHQRSPSSAIAPRTSQGLVPVGILEAATPFGGKANLCRWTLAISFQLASEQRCIQGLFYLAVQHVCPFPLSPSPALLCYSEGLICLSPVLFSAVSSQISVLDCIINTSECSKIIRFCSAENYVIGLNIGRLKIIPFRLLLLPLRDFLAGEERFQDIFWSCFQAFLCIIDGNYLFIIK